MAATIPSVEPDSFIAGDTVKWTKGLGDYLPADSWILSYSFVLSGDQQTTTAADNGDGTHLVTISAADSAMFTAGIYHWQAYVTLGDDRYLVGEGRIEVKPDFATQASGHDSRTHVKAVLDALEAMILGKASKDQIAYSVSSGDVSRSISRLTSAELLLWRDKYKGFYEQEIRAERIAAGLSHSGVVQTRFTS